MFKILKPYCFLYFVFYLAPILSGQESAKIHLGQAYSIYSEVLGEDRPYLIYLPDNYDADGQPLSVMYLLDGGGHFHHTTGIVAFLYEQGIIPNMMVVGIPNTSDRTRDLTPAITQDTSALTGFPTAGGADQMLDFIKNELIPKINSTYNTNNYKLLVGHSFGGIFSVNALLREPTLFDAHISISPSMWWDNQYLVERADSFVNTQDSLDVFYYMTMGNEGGSMLGGAMKLAALFEENSPKYFRWKFVHMEEETHGSVPHRSTYDGLEAIFENWFKADFEELFAYGGMPSILQHYQRLSSKFGSELSPSESELNSFGYSLMYKGAYDKALEVFQKNIVLYPTSFNVYDSAAEAYMELGNKKKAIELYKKSLEINPANINGVKMLKRLGVEHDPMSLVINLDKSQLQKYVGTYHDQNAGDITIEERDGSLILSVSGLDPQTLHPYPNQSFIMLPENVFLSFLIDSQTKAASGFEAQVGPGMTVHATRKNE